MATGLEDFFIKNSFHFKEYDKMFKVDLDGYVLIDLEEKNLGALDFISKSLNLTKCFHSIIH